MIDIVDGNIFNSGFDFMVHQVNCQGVMGSGIAKQVKDKYPIVYEYYKSLCDDEHCNPKRLEKSPLLGKIQIVYIDSNRAIINLFSQDKYGYDKNCYTDYDAIKKCFEQVNEQFSGKRIAIPYNIGCCRGGGDWSVVLKIIEETLVDCTPVFYRYDGK